MSDVDGEAGGLRPFVLRFTQAQFDALPAVLKLTQAEWVTLISSGPPARFPTLLPSGASGELGDVMGKAIIVIDDDPPPGPWWWRVARWFWSRPRGAR